MPIIRGLDVLIKVGGEIVGGQRNGSIEMSSETIDTTVKTTGGWTTRISGIKSWTTSCDGVYFLGDEGQMAVENAFMESETIEVEFSKDGEFGYKGEAIITSFNVEMSQDDIVSYTASLEGTGELVTVHKITP